MKKQNGWIGVSFEGTLCLENGRPIPLMQARVKAWIALGRTVKVFTVARESIEAIQDWCETHLGARLEVTDQLDRNFAEFWGATCMQVRPNTGESIADELEAVKLTASAGLK